jgi:hypothetical protein
VGGREGARMDRLVTDVVLPGGLMEARSRVEDRHYLAKPFTATQLAAKTREALEEARNTARGRPSM